MGKRGCAVASVVAALVLLAGCGSGEKGQSEPGPKPGPKTATGSLEQLAAKTHCDPKIQTDASELRQANCTTKDGRYVLATFATAQGQHDWLGEAQNYGGSYLVGKKWVAVGEPKVMKTLRGRLGGDVETAASHSQHSSAGGGGSQHSGHAGHH